MINFEALFYQHVLAATNVECIFPIELIFKPLYNNLPQYKLIHLKFQCVLPICFCLKIVKNTYESFTNITHASCLYATASGCPHLKPDCFQTWILLFAPTTKKRLRILSVLVRKLN